MGKHRSAAFIYSLAAFLLINASIAWLQPFHFDPNVFPYKGWSWWTIHEVGQSNVTPNVVLLGSSLMVAAIAECDANFQKRSLDLASYRGAAYLDKALNDKFRQKFHTLNLSAPGQMPSDAYLTLKASLQKGISPKVIIYGVAPRDFLDGTMQSPSDTEAFKFLQRYVDINDCAFDFFSSPFGKLDWLLQRGITLYQTSLDCRLSLEHTCRAFASHNGIFNLPEQEGAARSFAIRLRQIYQPMNIEKGTSFALQTTAETIHAPYDNRRDYQERYKNPDRGVYTAQLRFLTRIAQLCHQNNIALVLVDMPITKQNLDLLRPELYENYKKDLVAVARPNNVHLLEMCKFDQYCPADYKDTVHLNGFGGMKFVDNLVNNFASNPQLKSDLVGTLQSTNQGR